MAITEHAENKEDFIKKMSEHALARLAKGFLTLSDDENKVAVEIYLHRRKYRFNGNNKNLVVLQFLEDFQQHELVYKPTKTSGDKVDTINHAKKPRSGLYCYSHPKLF